MPDYPTIQGQIKRGTVVTYDRVANIQPEDWNRKIVELDTNAEVPFTAIMDAAGSETTKSRIYHWWQKDMPSPKGAITGVYTDGAMQTPYVSGLTNGQVLYLKMSEQDASNLVAGMQITANAAPDELGFLENAAMVNLSIKNVSLSGASSRVVVSVNSISYDGGGTAAGEGSLLTAAAVASGLHWFLSGDNQPENSQLPDSTFYEPVEFFNRTAISMGSCQMSGSELKELERVDKDKWDRAIADALRIVRRKREYQSIFGTGNIGRDAAGRQIRYYKGVRQMALKGSLAPDGSPNNDGMTVWDVKAGTRTQAGTAGSAGWTGLSWANYGLKMLDDIIVNCSRVQTNVSKKSAWLGDLGMQAINEAVRASTHYEWSEEKTIMGVRLKTLNGTVKPVTFFMHPLFNEYPSLRRSMFVTEMPLVKRVGFRPLQFITGKSGNDQSGYDFVDGKMAGWLLEETLMMTHSSVFSWVSNLGANPIA